MIVYKTLSVFDSETNTLVRRVCLIVEYGSGGFSWVLESRRRSAFLKAQLGKYAETDHSSFAFHFHSSMAFDPSTDLHCKYIKGGSTEGRRLTDAHSRDRTRHHCPIPTARLTKRGGLVSLMFTAT